MKAWFISGVQQKDFLPELSEREMGPLRSHEPVCIDNTKETPNFLEVAGGILLKDGRNTFF